MARYVFGPVPSRRLGKSLGINNIPGKVCTYSCIYCQAGRTVNLTVTRKSFYDPQKVADEVVEKCLEIGFEKIDYITFVPNGEPTLDVNLGKIVDRVRSRVDVKLAILTNGSLIWMSDVADDLMLFDLVSVKLDSGLEDVWRRINRPHPRLSFSNIMDGILEFSKTYSGKLITETMLVKEVNDSLENARAIAEILSKLGPNKAYISVPIRPPSEKWVKPPDEKAIAMFYHEFSRKLGEDRVETLTGYETDEFIVEEDPREYIAKLTRVHPLRLDYAEEILRKKGINLNEILAELENKYGVVVVKHLGHRFLVKRLRRE
ncbi:MAG: radical SAM protein [Thermoprotei archaeon]|nr:MAG: radical SAM protein [Thermoprotei archaeon]